MRPFLIALALFVTFPAFADPQVIGHDTPVEEAIAAEALPKAVLVKQFFRTVRPDSAGEPGGIFDQLAIDSSSQQAALLLHAASEAQEVQSHGSAARDSGRWQAKRLGWIYQRLLNDLAALGFPPQRIEEYVDTVVRERVTVIVAGGQLTFTHLEEAFRDGENAALEGRPLTQERPPEVDPAQSRLALTGFRNGNNLDLSFSYQPGALEPPPDGLLIWAEPSHTLLLVFSNEESQSVDRSSVSDLGNALAEVSGAWAASHDVSVPWIIEGDHRIVVEFASGELEQSVVADAAVALNSFDIVTTASLEVDGEARAWFHECRCHDISSGSRCASPAFSCSPSTCAVACRARE